MCAPGPGRIIRISDKLPPLIHIQFVPVFRQRHIQVFRDNAFALIVLHGQHLLFLRHHFQLRRQIQRFPRLRKQHGFRPDHLHRLIVQIPGPVFPVAGHLHIPEAAVAGDIPQVAVFRVGRSEENALPEVRRYPPPEGSTVLVVLPGDKGLHLIDHRHH